MAHNLVYLLIVLLVVSALVPHFSQVQYPVYAGPSLWSLIVLLIILRFFGII